MDFISELYATECVVYFVHMLKSHNNMYNFAFPFLSELKNAYVWRYDQSLHRPLDMSMQ
jgi:hypothetical protein